MTSGVKRCTPPVDGDVIDVDATLGEQFFDVPLRESVAEIPAHGQQDHVRREPVAGERDRNGTATTDYSCTLRAHPIPERNRASRSMSSIRRSDQSNMVGGDHRADRRWASATPRPGHHLDLVDDVRHFNGQRVRHRSDLESLALDADEP
jgi:hypothetical protein